MLDHLLNPRSKPSWWQRADLFYQKGQLTFAGVNLDSIGKNLGTPTYVYSRTRIEENITRLQRSLTGSHPQTRLFYAMKSNRYPPLLQSIAEFGNVGIDACSAGEVKIALECGFSEEQITFTATGMSFQEWEEVLSFSKLIINADSFGDIQKIGSISPGREIGLRMNAGVSLGYRQNPKLVYTASNRFSKFGISPDQLDDALQACAKYHLEVIGIHSHCGCGYLKEQLPQYAAFLEILKTIALSHPHLRYINLGGGLGIPLIESDSAWDLDAWSALLRSTFEGWSGTLYCEPGDYLVKDAGILLTSVTNVEIKASRKVVWLNAGFNIHPEPVFYDLPLFPVPIAPAKGEPELVTFVGNINEAHDIWMENLTMPPIAEGDTVALLNAGGYGASMSSNHCCRGHFSQILIPFHAQSGNQGFPEKLGSPLTAE